MHHGTQKSSIYTFSICFISAGAWLKMQPTFLIIAVINLVVAIISALLNAGAFDSGHEACDALFGDHALLLAASSVLVLTTPWHIATQSTKHKTPLATVAVPLALLLIYATCTVIAINGEEIIDLGQCKSANGRYGAYASIVWLSLFCFLHTTAVSFITQRHTKYDF